MSEIIEATDVEIIDEKPVKKVSKKDKKPKIFIENIFGAISLFIDFFLVLLCIKNIEFTQSGGFSAVFGLLSTFPFFMLLCVIQLFFSAPAFFSSFDIAKKWKFQNKEYNVLSIIWGVSFLVPFILFLIVMISSVIPYQSNKGISSVAQIMLLF